MFSALPCQARLALEFCFFENSYIAESGYPAILVTTRSSQDIQSLDRYPTTLHYVRTEKRVDASDAAVHSSRSCIRRRCGRPLLATLAVVMFLSDSFVRISRTVGQGGKRTSTTGACP
jgi:hypothetical protein